MRIKLQHNSDNLKNTKYPNCNKEARNARKYEKNETKCVKKATKEVIFYAKILINVTERKTKSDNKLTSEP